MTITVSAQILYFFIGLGSGLVLAMLLFAAIAAFGRAYAGQWLSPSRAAGLRRTAKAVIGFSAGFILSNAATWVVAALIHFHVNQATADALGGLAGAALMGVHQNLTWTTEPPTPPVS